MDELDRAVARLDEALTPLHNQKLARTEDWGRVLVARQAIAVSVHNAPFPRQAGEPPVLAVDQLFTDFNSEVGPWIDLAFIEDWITDARTGLRARMPDRPVLLSVCCPRFHSGSSFANSLIS